MVDCEYRTSVGDGSDDAPGNEEGFKTIGSDIGDETMQTTS